MKEQVDELGDLKIIDCDCWLVFGGNDQALLDCSRAERHALPRHPYPAVISLKAPPTWAGEEGGRGRRH